MTRSNCCSFLVAMSMVATLCGQFCAWASCLPEAEYQPTLVANPEGLVSFHCSDATAFDLIRAVAYQTRVPLGIVLGRDPVRLSRARRTYNLDRMSMREALRQAVLGTGYVLREEGGVQVLIAGDSTARQKRLLGDVITGFKPIAGETMAELSFLLTAWLRALRDPGQGTAASILGSTNDEGLFLTVPPRATAEAIANLIVSQRPGGTWILRSAPSARRSRTQDEIAIESYQHYSNAPG